MKIRWLAALLLCSSGVSVAAPGALDATFDADGIVTTAIGVSNDYGYSVAIQPDGKVVVAGYSSNGINNGFALVRYNSNGSLDTSFDGDGKVTTTVGASGDVGYSVAVQPDGKLVVAGYSFNGANNDFALARYNSDGSLDTTFDGDGKVTTPVGASDDTGRVVAIQSDGKIVVAGSSSNGTDNDFALVRYNSDGSLDITFDGDGRVITPIGASDDDGYSIAVHPDGKLVVAGSSFNGTYSDFALARYNSDGSLDTTFGGVGMVTTSHGTSSAGADSIAMQPDGKMVVAGNVLNSTVLGNYLDLALARYNSDGSLDLTFDADGLVTTAISASNDAGKSVAVQPDGKIVVAGYTFIPTGLFSGHFDFVLARYNSDGSLDASFNGGGKITTPIGASSDYGNSVAVQSDGRLVVAGASSNGANDDFALARYVATDISWDITPTAFSFTDQSGVALSSTRTSDVITVAGLGAGVKVPLLVSGGSYSLNGGTYTTGVGWVQNGDTITVRQTSSTSSLTAANTTLTFGGLVAANNAAVLLGGTVSDVFTSITGDAAPDAFAFTDQTDVALASIVISAPVTISGINITAPVSVTGGEYSVGCTGVFTSTAGTVSNGDTVCVRHTAAATYSSAANTTLTVGGISDILTSTTVGNAIPDPYSFADVTGQPLNSTVTSDAITVSGTTLNSDISVSGGEYSIGCTASFTTAIGTIANGETVCVRHTTSASYSTTVETTLTIGGVSDIFSSTTFDFDAIPDAFTFIDQTGVALDAVVESAPVIITGINGPTSVSVEGGEYSVGCTGTYATTAGTLNDGDSVCVRHTASALYEATVDTTLTVGGASDVFSSTTAAAPAGGDSGSGGRGGTFDPLMALGALAAFGLRRRRAKGPTRRSVTPSTAPTRPKRRSCTTRRSPCPRAPSP